MAPVASLMYACAGVIVGVSLALPNAEDPNTLAIVVLAALGAGAAVFIWLARNWLPRWFFQVSTASGSVIVALLVQWGGDAGSAYPMLLVWVAVFSAYFFTVRQVVAQLVFAGAAYAIALAAAPGSDPDAAVHWLLTVVSLAMAAVIIGTLVQSARGLARERELLLAEAIDQARTDPLTGLLNRRAFSELLDREMSRAERSGSPLCVALLDLDHFKSFNDEFGHPAGDKLLVDLAELWGATLRPADALARYGGEEFALLLPGCEPDSASEVVERVRLAVPESQTCSAGLACWDGNESSTSLLTRADARLYEAKRAGRDQLVGI